jgi:hypothetical protein
MRTTLAAIAMACTFAAVVKAEVPYTITDGYSPYEEATLRDGLARVGGTLDPKPEGKTLERIEIVTLDPIEHRDPIPLAFNAVHFTTRREVIEREVLLRVGTAYRQALVDETARNLRALPQQSLVLCVAIRGSAPGRVRLLVITKDVWSLFVDFDLAYSAGGLEQLVLKPREANVLGTQNTVLARLILEPKAFSLGAGYIVPRLDGQWLALVVDANLIFERQSKGRLEGSFGSVTVTRPLFSARTEWGWVSGVTWRDEMFRRYTDAKVELFHPTTEPEGDGVPWAYRARSFAQQLAITRSLGWEIKNDLTFGAEMIQHRYDTPDLTSFKDQIAAAAFPAKIPTSERRVGPFVQWHGFTTDYLRILDFETLGLQEDVPLGHDVVLRVYPVTRALGSTRTFLGVYAAAQYTVPLGDGLARAAVISTTEAEADRLADASLEASIRVVTPRLGFGRLFFDAALTDRYRNQLNVLSFLGGDSRLRGFPTRYLVGKDQLAMNLEFRTRPVEVASIQMGAAMFYDVGDAFDTFSELRPKHSVGIGTRMVFPQIDRSILRFDVGFPMPFGTRPAGISPVSFFIAFDHAFPLTAVGTNAATTTPTIGGALGY